MAIEEQDDLVAGGLPEFLRDPVGIVRRRWPWMLLALLVGLVATTGFLLIEGKPRYVASATVLLASQRIPKDFVRSTVREDPSKRINAIVGEILSRERLTELIEKNGLYPELRTSVLLADLVQRMLEDISIEPVSGIGFFQRGEKSAQILRITFRADSPAAAAAVANDLADRLIDASIRNRTQQAQITTDFLRRELERAERELREQNRKITEFKEGHRGGLPADLESNLRKLERLQQQRQSLALGIEDAETRLATIFSSENSVGPGALPEVRLATMRARLVEELAVHTEMHPAVTSLRQQIAALQDELEGAGPPGATTMPPSVLTVSQRTIEELRVQVVATEASIRQLDSAVTQTPAIQEKLVAFEEKASVLREDYLAFLRKVQEAELAQSLESAQQGERMSLLDAAVPPNSPERTRVTYLAAGVMLSFGLSLAIGVLLEILDPVLIVSAQIESEFGVPLLGSVPRIS